MAAAIIRYRRFVLVGTIALTAIVWPAVEVHRSRTFPRYSGEIQISVRPLPTVQESGDDPALALLASSLRHPATVAAALEAIGGSPGEALTFLGSSALEVTTNDSAGTVTVSYGAPDASAITLFLTVLVDRAIGDSDRWYRIQTESLHTAMIEARELTLEQSEEVILRSLVRNSGISPDDAAASWRSAAARGLVAAARMERAIEDVDFMLSGFTSRVVRDPPIILEQQERLTPAGRGGLVALTGLVIMMTLAAVRDAATTILRHARELAVRED